MRFIFLTLVLQCYWCYCALYSLQANRLNNDLPIIDSLNPKGSSGSSSFLYNYNVAYVPHYEGLMVRCQNTKGEDPYIVAPSEIAYAQFIGHWKLNLSDIQVDPITQQSVVIQPTNDATSYGTEDPRISFDKTTGIYYLMYSAVQNITSTGAARSRLSLQTSLTPFVASSWIDYGPIWPDDEVAWSKSGALFIRPGELSYLYWGDSTLIPGIQLATTENLINYTYYPDIFIHTRNDSFDSFLIEAGPTPMTLSDGNILFIYNSARHGYPSKKPDWDVQYNVGWVIINGSDPTQILQRADEPLLSPELDWEIGVPPYLGLTPNVVFVEGWSRGEETDSFIIFYGAADSAVGVAHVQVTIQQDSYAPSQSKLTIN